MSLDIIISKCKIQHACLHIDVQEKSNPYSVESRRNNVHPNADKSTRICEK